MNEADYWNKTYQLEVKNGADSLKVVKLGGTNWSGLEMRTNGDDNGVITIRSFEMAQQLHFMLGRMLGKT